MISQGNELEQDHETASLAVPQRWRSSLWSVLARRRWIIVVSLATSLVVAGLYLLKATPAYTVQSTVLVSASSPRLLKDAAPPSQSSNYLQTQCELMLSSPILGQAVDHLSPGAKKVFRDAENPVAWLKQNLQVSLGKKDDIITVSLENPYSLEASELVNAVVDSYVAFNSEFRKDSAQELLRILQKEKVKYDQDLHKKLMEIAKFKETNGALSLQSDKGNIVLQRLASLSEAHTAAQLDRMEAEALHETVDKATAHPELAGGLCELAMRDGPIQDGEKALVELRRQEQDLLAQIQQLRQECTQEHPVLKDLLARQSELEAQRAKLQKGLVDRLKDWAGERYEIAKMKETSLARSLEAQQAEALSLNSKAAELALLEAELDRAEKLCDVLDERVKEVDVNGDSGALNISVLEVAKPDEKPTSPNRSRILAAALVVGLLLGVMLALLRDWRDDRFQNADEVTSSLGMRVLGTIPSLPSASLKNACLDARSDMAESCRTVRTAIRFGASSSSVKTLLLTSPLPGEGKTTLAANLAVAMAQSGLRTLLLDADFRRPMQHKLFSIGSTNGLCNVLAGETELSEAIRPSGTSHLDILPCGTIPHNPAELLGSDVFTSTLRRLCDSYDRIVIDSPPVLPVADARVLAALADITLLVVRAGQSRRRASNDAIAALHSVGGRVLGMVVNAVDAPKQYRSYYRKPKGQEALYAGGAQ